MCAFNGINPRFLCATASIAYLTVMIFCAFYFFIPNLNKYITFKYSSFQWRSFIETGEKTLLQLILNSGRIKSSFFCTYLEILPNRFLIFFSASKNSLTSFGFVSYRLWGNWSADKLPKSWVTTKPFSHNQTDGFCVKFMGTVTVYLFVHCVNDLVTW